jgi:peptide methionine sulfoxide reductase MsrA
MCWDPLDDVVQLDAADPFIFHLRDRTSMNCRGKDGGADYRLALLQMDDDRMVVAERTIAVVEPPVPCR